MNGGDFFEAPPPREREDSELSEPKLPPWVQPPQGVLPSSFSLGQQIARSDQATIGVVGGLVYDVGFELRIFVFVPAAEKEVDPFDSHRRLDEDGTLRPELLRIGLEYPDGHKSMTTKSRAWDLKEAPAENEASIRLTRGSGWHREWQRDLWCWPLPTAGPLQLVCEWPAMDIELTRSELDGQRILDAASRVEKIL